MPRSVPVSRLMIHRREWPQLKADTQIKDAIRILRILSEDRKLEHGHSTPLVLDKDYNLLGMIRLIDLLRSVRHLCEDPFKACDLGKATNPITDIVIPFPASVKPDDSILEALDIMTNHGISLVPVMEEGKLQGLIMLADIFNIVAALLFDEEEPEGPNWIDRHLHF
jgi:CBS domain-containing protein